GISYVGQSDVYVVGDSGTILKGNLALHYSVQIPPFIKRSTNLYGVSCSAPYSGQGYIVGENGTILKTTNSGTIWTIQNSSVTSTLRGVFSPPPFLAGFRDSVAWAVAGSGVIVRTDDG